MKMKIQGNEIEGTPNELADFLWMTGQVRDGGPAKDKVKGNIKLVPATKKTPDKREAIRMTGKNGEGVRVKWKHYLGQGIGGEIKQCFDTLKCTQNTALERITDRLHKNPSFNRLLPRLQKRMLYRLQKSVSARWSERLAQEKKVSA